MQRETSGIEAKAQPRGRTAPEQALSLSRPSRSREAKPSGLRAGGGFRPSGIAKRVVSGANEGTFQGLIRLVVGLVLVIALGAPLAACSSDGDPYLESVRAELTTAALACGDARCSRLRQYCLVAPTTERRFGKSTRIYSCVALPVQCAVNPRCDCLAAPSCTERGGGLVVETLEPVEGAEQER